MLNTDGYSKDPSLIVSPPTWFDPNMCGFLLVCLPKGVVGFPSEFGLTQQIRYPLVGGLDWWFRFGFDPLLVEGK